MRRHGDLPFAFAGEAYSSLALLKLPAWNEQFDGG
jgi:hypothetical protein